MLQLSQFLHNHHYSRVKLLVIVFRRGFMLFERIQQFQLID
jgi:hypothetical protein